jgi:hypothetical protein
MGGQCCSLQAVKTRAWETCEANAARWWWIAALPCQRSDQRLRLYQYLGYADPISQSDPVG